MKEKFSKFLINKLFPLLKEKNIIITTVESCTGGGLVNLLTNIPGASKFIHSAFITYSNEAKIDLGVNPEIIEKHTVYSEETALAMAKAGLARAVKANLAIAITGELPGIPLSTMKKFKMNNLFIAIVTKDKEFSRKTTTTPTNRILEKEDAMATLLNTLFDFLEK